MSSKPPRMQPGSQRGRALVEAWNRSDAEYILDQLSNDITLEARLPKMPVLADKLTIKGKKEICARFEGLSEKISTF